MSILQGGQIIPGAVGLAVATALPVNGTNEVQLVTVNGSPTGGTFTLTFDGHTTGTIAYNAAAATVQTALLALPNLDSGDVVVTGSAGGPWTLTFGGNYARSNVNALTATYSGLTGGSSPTVTISTSTAGVAGTARGLGAGAILVDPNGSCMVNIGTEVNPNWCGRGVIKETILKSAFTDGGAAVGTYQLADSIPAGAVVLGGAIANTAFSGDTSAVVTIGDGSDVDRYNTGTPSVFGANANGVDLGVPSGVRFHAAAVRPTITITSATDFTALPAGASITVYLLFEKLY